MPVVFGTYELDADKRELCRAGEVVPLEPKAFKVLVYLLTHRHRAVSKSELLETLWPEEHVTESALSRSVRLIRQAVGDTGHQPRIIKTLRGYGYRFVADVTRPPAEAMGDTASERLSGDVLDAHVSEESLAVDSPPQEDAMAPTSEKAVGSLGNRGRTQHVIKTVQGRGRGFMTPVEERSQPRSRDLRKSSERYHQTHLARVIRQSTPLVARTQYLDQWERYLQEAITGQPHVVFIQGEAGIGKSRLLGELRSVAQQQGIQVCYGRCTEDLALPYLPFVDSLLAHLEHEFENVPSPLRADIEAIRCLRHPGKATPATENGFSLTQVDRDKLRLFLAVSRLTLDLAQRHPICFLLDDLHWADHPSLELFQHLVFTAADAMAQGPIPLLITVTYRPPEASSPLARFMSHFEREAICECFDLVSFDESDIATYIQAMNLGRPSNQLIAMIHTATRGNPLFIQEMFQYLVQTNALEERRGYLVTRIPPDNIQLPEHMTGVLAARLEALSQTVRQSLILASLLGNRFSLPLLSAVSEVGEDDLLDVLEEAMQQRLLLSEGQDFEFRHPMVRHVLYHAPSEARRQRLHYKLAQTLERLYADQLNAHSTEIAHHLIRSGHIAKSSEVLTYTRQAGAQALSMFAWTDAAHYFEAALAASETDGHLTDADKAQLHYQAGFAYQRAADAGPGMEHYDHAIQAYRQTGDVRGSAQALLDKTRTQLTLTGASYGTLIDVQPLHDVLEDLGDRDLSLRGHIASMMADIYCNAQQIDQAEEMAQHALEIGKHLGDDALCSRASSSQALLEVQGRQNVKAALQNWRAAYEYADRAQDLWQQASPLSRMALMLTLLGQIDEAEAAAREAWTVSRTLQSWGNSSLVLASLTAVHSIRGQFDLAEQHANESLMMASRSGFATGSSRAYFTLAGVVSQCGAWDQAAGILEMQIEPGRLFVEPSPSLRLFVKVFRQLVRAYQGHQLAEDLPSLADQLTRTGNPDAHPLSIACAMAEIGAFAAAPDIAVWGEPQLNRAQQQDFVFTSGWIFLVPRILGLIATLKHQWDMAETHFQTALAIADQTGALPELARTYLDYARMLIAQDGACQAERVRQLVSQAHPMFDHLGMVPFAQQAKQLMDVYQR